LTSPANILQVEHLGKSYSDFALSDVSFTLPAGYIMGFIGPNGAGKTTTIKAILNFISYSGEVQAFGQPARHAPGSTSLATRIGVVLDAPLFPEGWRIGDVERAIAPFYPQWQSDTFAAWLKRFELPTNKKVGELSRGTKTKLSLAVALSHNAELLILDEPTSGLDPGARDEICQVLREFVGDEQHSVLFSTHITQDLQRTADLITFILNGRLAYTGTLDELMTRYQRISGGVGELTADEQRGIIGYRQSAANFEGLVTAKTGTALSAHKGLLLEPATLDEIFVFCERQSKSKTAGGEGALL
jgi:ABC-2 type transport system ATP-binding protein